MHYSKHAPIKMSYFGFNALASPSQGRTTRHVDLKTIYFLNEDIISHIYSDMFMVLFTPNGYAYMLTETNILLLLKFSFLLL